MKPETLTEMERLQLRNQCAILEKLDTENAEHWKECQTILERGYTFLYHKILDPIWEELGYEECRYVLDVLDMHEGLQRSFQHLDDKDGITEDDVAFPGFDGNNESHHLCFAAHIKKGSRWETLATAIDSDWNSHFPTTQRYKRMLAKLNTIEDEHGMERKYRLSSNEIKEILDFRFLATGPSSAA
jgi:uncharacterized protein YfbU (UPF0304 family)